MLDIKELEISNLVAILTCASSTGLNVINPIKVCSFCLSQTEENQSFVAEFILLGLSQDLHTQILLFILFLLIYLLTVLGNLLIIILIFMDSRLHTPMYFFLRNLSFADLCFSTSIVPQVLVHFLVKRKNISFFACMTQVIVSLLVGCTECALLAVMSYDRYVAVCKPLHYSTIMTQQVCLKLAIGSWASGTLVSLVDTTFAFHLPYRGQNIINHYFCELPALLKLASADTYSTEMMAIFAMGVVILLAPVSLILASYWHIISTVIQMRSGEGRLKAFSTCGSHLVVVVLFYGSAIFNYMRPNSKTTKVQDKMISVFYIMVTPMLNPIIYSLRNKDVKGAVRKLAGRKFLCQCR
uniref:Olfactory receptor n=1 Tax=Microcebus murinus TaxID=30608 RepID=A0A8C5VQ62_MICMU